MVWQKWSGIRRSYLDHMGSTELAANLFRATQAEEKLRRDNIQGKNKANQTHFDVGQKVRQTISELGGLMPENLPTPDTGISQIELASNKSLSAPQSHSLMASTKRKFIKFDETQYIKLRRGPKKTWVVIWSYKFSGESSKQFSSESFKTFDEGYNRYSYICDNLIKNGYKLID